MFVCEACLYQWKFPTRMFISQWLTIFGYKEKLIIIVKWKMTEKQNWGSVGHRLAVSVIWADVYDVHLSLTCTSVCCLYTTCHCLSCVLPSNCSGTDFHSTVASICGAICQKSGVICSLRLPSVLCGRRDTTSLSEHLCCMIYISTAHRTRFLLDSRKL